MANPSYYVGGMPVSDVVQDALYRMLREHPAYLELAG